MPEPFADDDNMRLYWSPGLHTIHPSVSLAPAAPVPVAATRTVAPLALPLRLLDLIHSSFLFLRVFRTATNFNCTSLQFVEICCTSLYHIQKDSWRRGGIWGLRFQAVFGYKKVHRNSIKIPVDIWQITLTLIEFQEGVHFRSNGGAVVFKNALPSSQMRYHKLQHIFYNRCCRIQSRATIAWSFTQCNHIATITKVR